MINQHWFRHLFGAVGQQAINLNPGNPDLDCCIPSLGHSKLKCHFYIDFFYLNDISNQTILSNTSVVVYLISTLHKGVFISTASAAVYTLGKKGCYTPIEYNKTNVDRTFVFPLGWNWHDMDLWLFPNEIRHYLGQTFNARSNGIVEFWNHSIGGRSPKSIFTLWQLWINICIFFQKFFWLFEQCPIQPLWVLGMRCLHLPVRALSKVLLLPVWVWLVLPSTAYSKGRWEICMEWGLVAQGLTTDSCYVVTGHIDLQRSPCWLPTTVVSAWSWRRGGGTWQWPTGSMSSSVMSRDSNFTR